MIIIMIIIIIIIIIKRFKSTNTIHKSQGLTLPNAWTDLGMQEKSAGLSYVVLSRVRSLKNLIVESMSSEN